MILPANAENSTAILAHEFGHLQGLDHYEDPNESSLLMYISYDGDGRGEIPCCDLDRLRTTSGASERENWTQVVLERECRFGADSDAGVISTLCSNDSQCPEGMECESGFCTDCACDNFRSRPSVWSFGLVVLLFVRLTPRRRVK